MKSSDDTSDEESTATTLTETTVEPTVGSGSGWTAVAEEVDNAIAEALAQSVATGTTQQAVVTVDLKGTDTVPESAISAIAGKDVTLSLNVDEKTIVSINGSQLDSADVSAVKVASGQD